MENYDKLKEIGKGSYGVVWLVKNIKDKKNYVLKRIDLRKSSERDKQSSEQEAKLLKSLKHPNIVSYKESFQAGGYLNIVMLFCEGGDLYSKIKEQNGKPIEEAQIVEWFVQITMALQYMHEKCILHRDLKTQNIFLTRNKIIKVGDLGIARVLKSNSDMATTIIGTPYYMSPELFSNKPYNSKSDVWALGCCVYEMTTLKHAFNAKDMSSLVYKVTRGKMPDIPSIYSKDFVALIKSMLNPDPKLRPTANKILRDPFIKKNIISFLDRMKQKQQEQLENDNKKIDEVKERPKSSEFKLQESPKPVKSEYSFVNKNGNFQPKIEPNYLKKSESESNNLFEKEKVSESKPEKKNVRINEFVERYEIEDQSFEEEEQHEPYKLTKPIKFAMRNDFLDDEEEEFRIAKPLEKKVENPPQVQPRIVSLSIANRSKIASQSTPDITNQRSPDSPSEPQIVGANLSARERRRQKIRLSQGDSGVTKPPLLRKFPLKSNKSDDFTSNKNNQNVKPISKSLNEQENGLQDSMKIFRQNNIDKIAPIPDSRNIYEQQNKLERDPFFAKKQSSSSSSSLSSNEENDPRKQVFIMEKRDRKDKKERNNLIDALTLTIKTINNLSDLKDEVFDEVDEGDILEEVNDFRSNRNEKRSSFSSFNRQNEVKENPIVSISNNHLHKKMKEAEDECIQLVGKEKVDQAFKLLDEYEYSFNEHELESKLVDLIGYVHIDCIEKLRRIKCFKDASKFGIR